MLSCDILTIYDAIMKYGIETKPRDQKIKELLYFQAKIVHPWSSAPARNMNMDYIKREFQWFLTADLFDTRIEKHAKMWSKIKQPNGSINSNYGFYWFATRLAGGLSCFDWVVETLKKDPDSRQAYIPMLDEDHMWEGNPDVVCTKGIQFRVIQDILFMHVSMRSSDAIYGLHTDLIMFTWLHQMVCQALQKKEGSLIFAADSVHIYEKHWAMARRCVVEDQLEDVEHPAITDPYDLIHRQFKTPFGQWLLEAEL